MPQQLRLLTMRRKCIQITLPLQKHWSAFEKHRRGYLCSMFKQILSTANLVDEVLDGIRPFVNPKIQT